MPICSSTIFTIEYNFDATQIVSDGSGDVAMITEFRYLGLDEPRRHCWDCISDVHHWPVARLGNSLAFETQ